MTTDNKLSKELYQHYHKLWNDLLNTYCQARKSHPFEAYPEMARALWRVGVCMEAWYAIAMKVAKHKYYQGD